MRLALFLALVASFVHADNALNIGANKQLFIDHRFIAASENVSLRMNPAQKLGRLLAPDGKPIHGHISRVLDVDGKARLYIGADRTDLWESEDGLHFRNTGKSVGGGVFTTIFLDEHDPDPARRYKAFWLHLANPHNPETDGVYAAHGPDGENFTPDGRVLPYYTDNPCIAYWDERIEKYVVFTRALQLNNENQRRIARIETDDLLKPWPHTRTDHDSPFFMPENGDVVLAADAEDDPFSDIYYNAATRYPFAQDAYLMFTAQFRHFTRQRQPFLLPPRPEAWEDFGLLEIQLAASRDGITWTRPTRDAYFPTGLADEWDRWYAVMAPGLVRRGNYLYQYYNSSGRTHDSAILRPEYKDVQDLGGIGAVRQRLDGFVSADTDHHGGWLETPPLTFTGARLRLNIDTGAMGTAYVELRDASGTPLPGYTLADCEEIGGNFIDQQVYWRGNPDVSPLAGREIRLYLKLTRAKLYAFQFAPE